MEWLFNTYLMLIIWESQTEASFELQSILTVNTELNPRSNEGSLSMFSLSDCDIVFMYCVLIFVHVDVTHGAAGHISHLI